MLVAQKRGKKGLSPVVATVLLVAMVLIIALIIFLWLRGLTKEAIIKFGDKNIELVCQDVSFSADYDTSSNTLSLSNLGNVPIYSFNLKISKKGGHETKDIKEVSSGWPTNGLRQGGIFSEDLSAVLGSGSGATKVLVIPILLGKSGSERKTHTCEEQYGKGIVL